MYVYIIRACDSSLVKIGYSTNPKKRMKDLQSNSMEKLKLLRVIDGSPRIERWFHQQFEDLKVHGEWFKFHAEMLTINPPKDLLGTIPKNSATTVRSFRIKKTNADYLCELARRNRRNSTQQLEQILEDLQKEEKRNHKKGK